MYSDGMSIPQIGRIVGVPTSTTRRRLLDAGVILRTPEEGNRLAREQGRIPGFPTGPRDPFSDEWKANISRGRRKWAEENAVGVSLKPSGYLEYTRGEHKDRRVHVLIMESVIGRRLFRNECVHHINHDKTDNRIENLALMTVSEHSRLHAKINHKSRDKKNGRFC